jgi:hypothetical protein
VVSVVPDTSVINKNKLTSRLDEMLMLPLDWDGFGTTPISPKVHCIARQMIEFLPVTLYGLKIFVGVNNEGSLFMEFDLNHKFVEMTIMPDGTIHYDEVVAGVQIGSGSFYLNKEQLDSILSS